MNETQLIRWNSGNKVIHRSKHHKDLYIINRGDGRFHTIYSSYDLMINKYAINGRAAGNNS